MTPRAEFVSKSEIDRTAIQRGASFGRGGALIEQKDVGEVVAQAGASLPVGTRDRSWSADCYCGRLRQLGNGCVQTIANDVIATSRLAFQDAPEEAREVGDVHGRPVLLSRADHDQVAGIVPG